MSCIWEYITVYQSGAPLGIDSVTDGNDGFHRIAFTVRDTSRCFHLNYREILQLRYVLVSRTNSTLFPMRRYGSRSVSS